MSYFAKGPDTSYGLAVFIKVQDGLIRVCYFADELWQVVADRELVRDLDILKQPIFPSIVVLRTEVVVDDALENVSEGLTT